MGFIKSEKNETDYFYFPLKQKVDFYYDIFISDFAIANKSIIKNEVAIKYLILQELDSYEVVLSDFCQIKRDRISMGIKKLNSELGHLVGWNIDWYWILHHIILDYRNIIIALHLKEKYKNEKVLVYKYVPTNNIAIAGNIYLKDCTSREPRCFELDELFTQGFGLKANTENIKPIIGVTLWKGFDNNYWDLTELKMFRQNYEWNCIEHRFIMKPITNRPNIK